jgi:HAD superfamily hydrolase (TIGR01549 family)
MRWPSDLGGRRVRRELLPDALSTLDALHQRGLRLGCVTNRWGPRVTEDLTEMGLDGHFEVVSASCDVGFMKPHPRIFQHALDALGIGPSAAAMVGDLIEADVAGARDFGLTAIWVCPETREAKTGGISPHHRVRRLRELLDLGCLSGEGPIAR